MTAPVEGGLDWFRVAPLLEALAALPAEARSAYLDEYCSDDDVLRERLVALLEADADDDGFLASPLANAAQPDGERADELADERAGERVGPFRLVRSLGQGGMGEVWLADRAEGTFEQRVAVKLIHRGLETTALVRRFEKERQVLAWLEHPGIARLIDGGVDEGGRPYLAMEYVEGERLDRFAARIGLEQRLALFLDVLDAVAHAHERGVVHRDLKPTNILVDARGRPRLLDFGIAKVLGANDEEQSLELTRTGQRLYSPLYASPEQVRGDPVTAATDVYALGVILCELLTGRRPYEARTASPLELERAVCETRPARPSDLASSSSARRKLRGNLDWIVATALRKEPERRYANASALAADLRRHLSRDRVLARSDSPGYRVRTFVRRNRTVTVAASVAFLALAVATGVSWYERGVAVDAQRESRWSAYAAALQAAETSLRAGMIQAAADRLAAAPEELAGWELRHLISRQDNSEARSALGGSIGPDAVAWLGDGRIIVGSQSGVALFDGRAGERTRWGAIPYDALRSHYDVAMVFPSSVSVHLGGDVIALNSLDRRFCIVDAVSLEVVRELEFYDSFAYQAEFDPTGRWLACATGAGWIHLLSVPEYEEVARVQAHGVGSITLAFDPQGERLASGSWDEHIRLWTLPELELEADLVGHDMEVTDVAFAADGGLLVTASLDRTVRVWDLNELRTRFVFRDDNAVFTTVAARPGTSEVFTGDERGRILRWDARTGEVLGRLVGHTSTVRSIDVSAAGDRVASCSTANLRLWSAAAQDVPRISVCEFSRSLDITAAEDELVLAQADGHIRRWALPGREPLAGIVVGSSPLVGVGCAPANQGLWFAQENGRVGLWRPGESEPVWERTHDIAPLRQVVMHAGSGHGLLVQASGNGASAWRMDLDDGELMERLVCPLCAASQQPPTWSTVSRGAPVGAWGDGAGHVLVIDLENGRLLAQMDVGQIPNSLALDAGGTRLAVGFDGGALLWNVGADEPEWSRIDLGHFVTSIAFHPTEARMALGTGAGLLIVLDATTGRHLVELDGMTSRVAGLRFTADGETLVSTSAEGSLLFWGSR